MKDQIYERVHEHLVSARIPTLDLKKEGIVLKVRGKSCVIAMVTTHDNFVKGTNKTKSTR